MTSAEVFIRCQSIGQFASVGPAPPRTLGRPDAQVPENPDAGPALYASLPHVYFYDANRPDDPAFGFIDIEISLQRRDAGHFQCDLYCCGDGAQSGAGLPNGGGLKIEFLAGDHVVAAGSWMFSEVVSGRCDPMSFAMPLTIADDDYRRIDRVRLPSTAAICRID